ncbi:hypothetical protein RMATCC62417_15181 [Rhizopus microsporus]|nr:hypothetical protein RMATCC62417_15181 [Rhizopus microsporus]
MSSQEEPTADQDFGDLFGSEEEASDIDDGRSNSPQPNHAPVKKDDAGVKMLAGYSANMLKTFLDGDDIGEDKAKQETPLDFAKKAVYHESFKDLVVVD